MDNIRTAITGDARYYVQELKRSFKFSFEPEADRLELRVLLYTLLFSPEVIQQEVLRSVAVLAEVLLGSPRKSFVFIIKKYRYWIKVSENKLFLLSKNLHWSYGTQGSRSAARLGAGLRSPSVVAETAPVAVSHRHFRSFRDGRPRGRPDAARAARVL